MKKKMSDNFSDTVHGRLSIMNTWGLEIFAIASGDGLKIGSLSMNERPGWIYTLNAKILQLLLRHHGELALLELEA